MHRRAALHHQTHLTGDRVRRAHHHRHRRTPLPGPELRARTTPTPASPHTPQPTRTTSTAPSPGGQWLLEALGHTAHQTWNNGRSWRLNHTYLVFEQSPALTTNHHDRRAPGLNHLAFHAGKQTVDLLTTKAQENGWTLLFPDRHPHTGGPQQYAAYLESTDGFEIELVASDHN